MAGVTFGQLPAEEPAFLAYLQTTGDVWARAVWDDVVSPRFEPLPVAEFLERHGGDLRQYDGVDVYLGARDAILQPQTGIIEVVEGGTQVQKLALRYNANPYVRYRRGEYWAADGLSSSKLGFPSSWFNGQVSIKHAPEFQKWGTNILSWMRRRTPESVPLHRCNYEVRATVKLAQACREGLKLGI